MSKIIDNDVAFYIKLTLVFFVATLVFGIVGSSLAIFFGGGFLYCLAVTVCFVLGMDILDTSD